MSVHNIISLRMSWISVKYVIGPLQLSPLVMGLHLWTFVFVCMFLLRLICVCMYVFAQTYLCLYVCFCLDLFVFVYMFLLRLIC